MLSQQSSLSGTRTALMCQLAIAATEPASLGPSKMPQPWIHAYSVPERLTPSKRTGCPAALSNRLPDTRSAKPVAGVGAGVGVGEGETVGLGVGRVVGLGVGAGVGVAVGVRVPVGPGVGVPMGRALTVGVTFGAEAAAVGDALSAVVPLPGATVAGCVSTNSKSISSASAPAAHAIRNTSSSSLPQVDDRQPSDAARNETPSAPGR